MPPAGQRVDEARPPAATAAALRADPRRRIRVLVADDNPVVRHGLRTILAAAPDIEVVAEAADGGEALRQVTLSGPDLVLLDMRMPVLDGIGTVRALAGRVRVLVVSYTDDVEEVAAALRAGAGGYLVHSRFGVEELLRAVRGAVRGEAHLSPGAAAAAGVLARRSPVTVGGRRDLSAREAEIMGLVTGGLSNRDIGATLGVSEKTVKNTLSRIFVKLEVQSRTGAVARFAGRDPLPSAGGPR